MKTKLLKLKVILNLITLIRDPRKTDKVFAISEAAVQSQSPLLIATVNLAQSNRELLRLYQDGYVAPAADFAGLARLPENTFGHQYWKHMSSNGLSPEFYPHRLGASFKDYFVERVRGAHDMWHVLTGFDVSIPDELGLQAFTLAQLRAPTSALLIAMGFLHTLLIDQSLFAKTVDRVFYGYQLGLRARFLLGEKIEEKWQSDLAQLRVELGLAGIMDQ